MNTPFTSVRRKLFNAVALSALAVSAMVVVAVLALPPFGSQQTGGSAATAPNAAISGASRPQRLYGLNEQFYPSGAVVRAESAQAQRLFALNEMLYPSNVAALSSREQREQRLLESNERLNRNTGDEPTFWMGRPH